ncbi:MAG: serine hydrolase [Candidatus Aminicenantes bacterium]|nr:MAG: serine hydrolase [Candidatus Aminicenantes bacterium]
MKSIPKIIVISVLSALVSIHGCQTKPKLEPSETPGSVGMSAERLANVDKIIRESIDRKEFPGAVILIVRKGKTVWRKAFGHCQWIPELAPMDVSKIFDMASITKPVATTTSVMMLVEQGKLRLWDKVVDFVPEFVSYIDEEGKPGEDARLWHLLTHTSGLPPYTDAEDLKDKYGYPITLESMIGHIARLQKLNPPGKKFHYSCLGFITLSYIVKKVSGQTIAQFARANIFQPLGMNHTFYTPSEEFRYLCVPTQVYDGKPLIGVVHDPLARLLGGVSGNAGLFSTADDLAIFARMMLNHGSFNGKQILSPLAVDRMTEIYRIADFAGRGLGWDLESGYSTNQGDLFGPNAFGHTGYTGTSLVIDPDTETIVIFLTNSVHPEDKGDIVSMRSRVANVVAGSILMK